MLEKSTVPNMPMSGMMMSPTSDSTILPKAAPMITPMARSTTLPLIANSRNSLSIPVLLCMRASRRRHPTPLEAAAQPYQHGRNGEHREHGRQQDGGRGLLDED